MNRHEYAAQIVDALIKTFDGGVDNEWYELGECNPEEQAETRQQWIDIVDTYLYLSEAEEKVMDLS